MKVLHLDTNHPLLIQQLSAAGFQNHEDYVSSKSEIEKKINLMMASSFEVDFL